MSIRLLLLYLIWVIPNVALGSKTIIIGNYPGWSENGAEYHVNKIKTKMLTHLIYEQANVKKSGQVTHWNAFQDIAKNYPGDQAVGQKYRGTFNQLQQLKKRNPHLKTVIAIGGWRLSKHYHHVVINKTRRQRFVRSSIDFAQRFNFDGLVIDWRYPGISREGNPSTYNDPNNLLILLKELRRTIKQRKLNLSLAVSTPSYPVMLESWPIEAMAKEVDFFNVLSFDITGSWNSYTGHASPLYRPRGSLLPDDGSMHSGVQFFLKQNVDPQKIVINIPAIGRAWTDTEGLHRTSRSIPYGTFDLRDKAPEGIYSGENLIQYIEDPRYEKGWDDLAKASYLYSKTQLGGHFISFEDDRSVSAKLSYMENHNLGGVGVQYLYADTHIVRQAYHFFYPIQAIRLEILQAVKQYRILLLVIALLIISGLGWQLHLKNREQIEKRQIELEKLNKHLIDIKQISEEINQELIERPLRREHTNRVKLVASQAKAIALQEMESDEVDRLLLELQEDPILARLTSSIKTEQSVNDLLGSLIRKLQKQLTHLSTSPGMLFELHQVASNRQRLLYIKAEKGYSGLYMQHKKRPLYIHSRLTQLKAYYDQEFLFRIHRSYLVNIHKVNAVYEKGAGYYVALVGNQEIPIGGRYLKEIEKHHSHWFQIEETRKAI